MSTRDARALARRARRIVVKIGSATLTDRGQLRSRFVGSLARQTAALMDDGRRVVLVSSGAIACGSRALRWEHTGRTIPEKQAAAAVGQIGLCETYQRRFARHGRQVGQVLVTRQGLEDREGYLNARHTLTTLLDLGVVPIVNENDTVATEEIRFGDNDNLSATIVDLVGADLLVILTDVEGLYERPPLPGAPLPPLLGVVEAVTGELRSRAGGPGTRFGSGGMATKLQAAEAAGRCGAATVLCRGTRPDVLLRVARGEPVGTLILPGARLASRKHWLSFTARPRGTLVLDEGAVRAVRERGRSLLPAGVVSVSGDFGIGDPVRCVDGSAREVARGLSAYSAGELARIKGLPTARIAQVLGYSNGDEAIHRNDLVVLEGPAASPAAGPGEPAA
jgi:glutamate 5-kinase